MTYNVNLYIEDKLIVSQERLPLVIAEAVYEAVRSTAYAQNKRAFGTMLACPSNQAPAYLVADRPFIVNQFQTTAK